MTSERSAGDIAALASINGVGVDVVDTEEVARGADHERDVREVRCDFLQRATELGAVGDDEVEPVLGVATNGGRCVLDDQRVC